MEPIPFPKYVDAPQRLLFWTTDQVMPFAVLVVIGVIVNSLFLCMILGIGLSWVFTRYRESKPEGFLVYLSYWYGILVPKGRCVVNPFLKRILPG